MVRVPLNNPSGVGRGVVPTGTRLTCLFCEYTTPNQPSLRMHMETYHEAELAACGKRDTQPVSGNNRVRAWLLARSYIDCPHWSSPCPGPENTLMSRGLCNGWPCGMREERYATQ